MTDEARTNSLLVQRPHVCSAFCCEAVWQTHIPKSNWSFANAKVGHARSPEARYSRFHCPSPPPSMSFEDRRPNLSSRRIDAAAQPTSLLRSIQCMLFASRADLSIKSSSSSPTLDTRRMLPKSSRIQANSVTSCTMQAPGAANCRRSASSWRRRPQMMYIKEG